MKLKAAKGEYRIPDIGQVWRVVVTKREDEKRILRQVSLHDIPLLHRDYGSDAVGTPAVFAHDMVAGEGKHKLIFFPAPVTDMDAEIEFFPPKQVM